MWKTKYYTAFCGSRGSCMEPDQLFLMGIVDAKFWEAVHWSIIALLWHCWTHYGQIEAISMITCSFPAEPQKGFFYFHVCSGTPRNLLTRFNGHALCSKVQFTKCIDRNIWYKVWYMSSVWIQEDDWAGRGVATSGPEARDLLSAVATWKRAGHTRWLAVKRKRSEWRGIKFDRRTDIRR